MAQSPDSAAEIDVSGADGDERDRLRMPAHPPAPVSTLLGDLFGLRSQLAEAGVDFTGQYVSETAWNYRGGSRRDVTEAGEFAVGLYFDMEKVARTKGVLQITITYRRGKQLDREAGLGTLQEVQEIYGRGQTLRLTQLWYERQFLDGALAVKAGRTAPSEDFAAFSCLFQNLSFCGSQPGNLVGDYWHNWPVGQWGIRLRANYGRRHVQVAVYEVNPQNLDKRFTVGRFSGASGALIPFELGLAHRGDSRGGPVGSYKIGGWISTADRRDVLLDNMLRPAILTGLAPPERNSSHGVWLSIEQQVSGRSEDGESISGITLFLNATRADKQTSVIDMQIVAGLLWRDLSRGLPGDQLGFALARTHLNNRSDRAGRFDGKASRGSEYALELFYGFRPLGWLELRPNLQWIHQPGGRRDVSGVGIAGLKAALHL